MALILVIEPNPRHAAEVAAMAHRHLQAETLITASAARAVTELGERVPDLVLTAALLPGHEEVALADYLRQLGDRAAHVQTITIPILSGAAARVRGLASSLLGDRGKKDAPEGCDPALFAEQVSQYLQRAEEQRRTPPMAMETLNRAVDITAPPESVLPFVHAAAPERPPVQSGTPSVAASWEPALRRPSRLDLEPEPLVVADNSASSAGPPSTVVRATPAPVPPPSAASVVREAVVEPFRATPRDWPAPPPPQSSSDSREPFPGPEATQKAPVAAEAHPHVSYPTDAVEPRAPLPTHAEGTALVTRRPPTVRPGALTVLPAPRAATPAARPRLSLPPRRIAAPAPTNPRTAIEPEVLPPAEDSAVPQMPASAHLAPPAPQNVQHVIAIPTGNGGHVHASVNLAVAVSVQVAAGGAVANVAPVASIATTPSHARPSAPQDEWGFFDPAQCGFEALMARLDRVDRRSD